jgi:hypothetical protein
MTSSPPPDKQTSCKHNRTRLSGTSGNNLANLRTVQSMEMKRRSDEREMTVQSILKHGCPTNEFRDRSNETNQVSKRFTNCTHDIELSLK